MGEDDDGGEWSASCKQIIRLFLFEVVELETG